MKKSLTIILLVIGGLAANILVNAVVLAAWDFNGMGAGLSVISGAAAAAVICMLAVVICMLAVVICNKTSIKRRALLICTQAPALAIATVVFVSSAVEYHDVTTDLSNDMWSGLRYGLTVAFFKIFIVIFITVLTMTAALALTLGITYYRKKTAEIT